MISRTRNTAYVSLDQRIKALWSERRDTRDIAAALSLAEAFVSNTLARLRDAQVHA